MKIINFSKFISIIIVIAFIMIAIIEGLLSFYFQEIIFITKIKLTPIKQIKYF